MDLIDKYIGEASFPSGRTAYTPGDIVKIKPSKSVNRNIHNKKGKVLKSLIYPGKEKKYNIEVKLDNGKEVVVLNTDVELVKPRSIKEGKEFVHMYNDDKEWSVVHSIHNVPSMGGQQIKSFKDEGEAKKFAEQMAKRWKATLAMWIKKGNRFVSA